MLKYLWQEKYSPGDRNSWRQDITSPDQSAAPPPTLRLRFHLSGDQWRWAESACVGSPFQSAGFIAAWEKTRGRARHRPQMCLVAEDEDGIVALLPLEIDHRGPWRVACFPGETHANANGWRIRPGAPAPQLTAASLAEAAAAAALRIDALDLRRMPDISCLGRRFDIRPAVEERFAISLQGGLEPVLARGNAKRKRKKFRAQQRHFDALGGYAFTDTPAEERPAALATFFDQKRLRFAALSMPNPFADAGIEAFLLALFSAPEVDTRLYRIVSGDSCKALMGGIVENGVFWGMFSSFSDDADAEVSPGELLLWHLVEYLSAEGLDVLDLGPGEERYKRSWCDRLVQQYDAILPLTRAGSLYLAAAIMRRRLVFRVKTSPRLKRIAQSARRRLRGA